MESPEKVVEIELRFLHARFKFWNTIIIPRSEGFFLPEMNNSWKKENPDFLHFPKIYANIQESLFFSYAKYISSS